LCNRSEAENVVVRGGSEHPLLVLVIGCRRRGHRRVTRRGVLNLDAILVIGRALNFDAILVVGLVDLKLELMGGLEIAVVFTDEHGLLHGGTRHTHHSAGKDERATSRGDVGYVEDGRVGKVRERGVGRRGSGRIVRRVAAARKDAVLTPQLVRPEAHTSAELSADVFAPAVDQKAPDEASLVCKGNGGVIRVSEGTEPQNPAHRNADVVVKDGRSVYREGKRSSSGKDEMGEGMETLDLVTAAVTVHAEAGPTEDLGGYEAPVVRTRKHRRERITSGER